MAVTPQLHNRVLCAHTPCVTCVTTKEGAKDRLDLIPVRPLFAVARAFAFGCSKEGRKPWDWRKGKKSDGNMQWSEYIGAALRHLLKWVLRFPPDESGESHLTMAITNLLILADFEIRGVGIDDRDGGLLNVGLERDAGTL